MKIESTASLRLFVSADLHYLSKSLIDDEQTFDFVMRKDGKLSKYSDTIIDELIRQTIDQRPDALILCGDLTFNGERKSLLDLKKKLQCVQEQGIPVLVIPGNHDIEYRQAAMFVTGGTRPVRNISEMEFKRIMRMFGYQQAIACDPSSFSYMVQMKDVVLLFMDANTANHRGYLSDRTMEWVNQQLDWAEKQKKQIVTISHQNILAQSGLLSDGFVMINSEKIVASLIDRVLVHLSGHSHLQHCSKINGLMDICTESLCLYPLQYGVLTIDRMDWKYENVHLNILHDQAKQRYYASMYQQVIKSLNALEIGKEDKETMILFIQEINAFYFQGVLDMVRLEYYKGHKGWQLWNRYGSNTFWKAYVESMFRDCEQGS